MPSMNDLRSSSVLPAFMAPGTPLLGDHNLNDTARFVKIAHVPLIDVHDDPIKGNIDLKLLKLIAKNSNDRVEKGDPIVVTVGHMKRKNTIVVVRPDGSKIILPGTDEAQQPPIVGYAKNLTIDHFRDNDWLHGDFYIKVENASDPIENPFRSVERVVPPDDGGDDGDDCSRHYIDRISLLRTPPEREGGVIHYDREDGIIGCCGTTRRLLRLCYARDNEPLKTSDNESKESDMPMPNGAPVATEEEPPEGAGPTTDEPTPVPSGDEESPGGGGLPATVGEMSPQDFFEGFAHVLRLVLDEKAGEGGEGGEGGEAAPEPAPGGAGAEGGGTVPYEKDLGKNISTAVDAAKRVPYDSGSMTQAGGSNTSISGSKTVKDPAVNKGRVKYEKGDPVLAIKPNGTQPNLKDVISRVQYAKDKGETDEIMTYLYTQLADMQLNGRRVVYRQELHGLRDMEGVELSDEDIESLVGTIVDATPEGFETEKIKEIRKHYSRRAVNVPSIQVGLPPFATMGPAANRPATQEECRQATVLRMESGGKLGYHEALAAVRAK